MKAIRNVTLLSLSLVALALFAAAPAAYADTQTYMATVSNTLTPFSNAAFPGIPQWNQPGYTLTSVEVLFGGPGFGGTGTSNVTVTTTDTNPVDVNSFAFTDALQVTLSGNGITPLVDVVNGSVGSAFAQIPVTLATPYNSSINLTSNGLNAGNFDLLTSGLGAYEGTGNVYFDLAGAASATWTTSGGNISTSQVTSGGGNVEVIYTYSNTITPEPGTLTLFGTGLLGLAGMLRRKFMQAR
jgi:hypothetical protein